MPLSRYRIRNVYSFADPELHTAADNNDPEALLEAVAMAGLVGVLRQLGDLAEFAAEIFHELHEEVMASAARGHGLMARVQQLEAEFPSIEKEFLSQTSHSLFFHNTGVDWHPNLHIDQNLITQRDLPRFVMETYEACHGPPRLFLLDKYDVAGAGACLKRYTDPSFFKLDSKYSGMMNPKAQRERKIRKAKKKGSRWKNGGTPEVLPTSHAKLHQLFLEENIENHINDPACRVKLKRQLNGFPFDSKTGKSYMEKFLQTPTSDHNVVHEISSNLSPLKLPPNTTGESEIEILGIGALSPDKESLQRKKSPHSSPVVEETRWKPSMDESIEEIDYGKVLKPNTISEGETLLLKFYEEVDEKEIIVHGEWKIEGSADGYQSDDIASDAENYTDAIITMDSEMETNIEAKNDLCFLITANREVDSDTNKEQQDSQIHFSESQSIGNSTATEVGNNSSRKGISCFSCSDSLSINPSDGEVSAEVLPSTEIFSAEIVNMLSDQCSVNRESLPTQPLEYMPEFGEPSSSSYVTDSSAPTLSPLEPVNGSREVASVGPELDEISSYCNELNNGHINPEESRRYVGDNLRCTPNRFDVPSQTEDDFLPELSAENHPVEESDDGDACFLSHASLNPSTILELAPAKESSGNLLHDVLQAEYAEDECTKISMDSQIVAPHSIASNTEEQLLDSASPVLETSDVKPYGIVPEVDDVPPLSVATLISSTAVEDIQTSNFLKQQFLEITENVLSLDPDSEKFGCSYFTEENLYGASSTVDGEELCGLYSDVDMVGKIAADLPSDFHNSPDLPRVPEVHEHIDDVVIETLHPEAMTVATAVPSTQCDDSEDDGKSLSTRPTKVQEESISIILQDLHKSGLEIDEMCSPKHIPESGTEKEVDQRTVASSDLDPVISNAVSYDDSKSELLNNFPDFSRAAISRNSMHIFYAATVPLLSDQNDQDSESKSLQQIDVIENAEDVVSSPSLYIAVLTPPDQKVELQDAQFDVVSGDTGKESSEPFNNEERVQSVNHLDQEAHTDASSKLCVAHLPSQPSVAERLPQLDASEQAPDTSSSILPSFDLLPEASENNLDEMPPLPPLPPVQWRLGKVQHASLVPERDLVQYNMGLFPRIMSSAAGDKVQLGHLAKGETTQPSNQFLPLPAVKNQNSQHDHENLAGYMVHSTPLSMQLPTMVNHGNSEDDYPTSGRKQSVNPFLLLPTIFDKRSRRFPPPEDGAAQSPLNPFSPVASVKDTVSAYSTSQEELIQPLHQSAPQTSLEDENLRGISVFSEGKVGNPPDITSPPLMQEDQPQHVFSERETAWSSGSSVLLAPFEDGKPDGNRQKKLPLPRNPLIDAVVAHDKSKLRKVTVQVRPQIGQKLDERDSLMVQLRKVTERARPQIGQKLDERDSLLKQIRAKSFNLKPASATKSSIQGPKTNLKVAAILEKANSIRQALAGSDEDDDVDGWSDS